MITTIYCIRHGETDNNYAGCFNGCASNQSLNDRGRAQAVCLAPPFERIKPDLICASPLSRAVETAKGLRGALTVPIQTVEDLHEMDMGIYDGVSFEEVKRVDPAIMANWNCADVQMPGGESFSAVQSRACKAVARILAQNRGKTMAIVAHGSLFQIMLMGILQLPWSEKKRLPVLHNTGYYGLEIADDGTARLFCYDVTDHLPDELRRSHLPPSIGHDYVGQTFHVQEFCKCL